MSDDPVLTDKEIEDVIRRNMLSFNDTCRQRPEVLEIAVQYVNEKGWQTDMATLADIIAFAVPFPSHPLSPQLQIAWAMYVEESKHEDGNQAVITLEDFGLWLQHGGGSKQ